MFDFVRLVRQKHFSMHAKTERELNFGPIPPTQLHLMSAPQPFEIVYKQENINIIDSFIKKHLFLI